jgi:hypothetical protein
MMTVAAMRRAAHTRVGDAHDAASRQTADCPARPQRHMSVSPKGVTTWLVHAGRPHRFVATGVAGLDVQQAGPMRRASACGCGRGGSWSSI